jgi:hypothetical protein
MFLGSDGTFVSWNMAPYLRRRQVIIYTDRCFGVVFRNVLVQFVFMTSIFTMCVTFRILRRWFGHGIWETTNKSLKNVLAFKDRWRGIWLSNVVRLI